MAKTDLKSAFRLIPIHPDDWNLLGIYWQSQYYVDMYLPLGLRSTRSSLISCPTASSGSLKITTTSSMLFLSWTISLLPSETN